MIMDNICRAQYTKVCLTMLTTLSVPLPLFLISCHIFLSSLLACQITWYIYLNPDYNYNNYYVALALMSLYLSNIGLILIIPYVIVTTTNEDFYNIPSGFPSFICTTRNSDFFVIYLVFPAIFLCSLGVFLLSIIIFNIQMVNYKRDNCTFYYFGIYCLCKGCKKGYCFSLTMWFPQNHCKVSTATI